MHWIFLVSSNKFIHESLKEHQKKVLKILLHQTTLFLQVWLIIVRYHIKNLLGVCLFGAVKLTINADLDIYGYIVDGVGFNAQS